VHTICHEIDGHLYEKLERLAAAQGMTPDECAAKLGAELFFEKTRPRGAGKIRYLPTTRRDPPKAVLGPEKGGTEALDP